MKPIFSLLCLLFLMSCSKNSVDDRNCRFLLDIGIAPINIDLNLPSNIDLNTTGNSIYIPNAGNGGIIVTNVGFEFTAWDASDPNYIPGTCNPLIPEGLEATSDCGEGNKYSLVTGQPLENESLRCGLKRYMTEKNENIIVVFN